MEVTARFIAEEIYNFFEYEIGQGEHDFEKLVRDFYCEMNGSDLMLTSDWLEEVVTEIKDIRNRRI